ncbi:MAG: radical SAM protein [Pseudomonadota bacterium]
MNVLLLRPRPDPETIGLQHVMLVEPLELEVLGALTRPPFVPVIVDLVLERRALGHFLAKHRPRIVAVTGYLTNVPAMIAACREAKARDPRVVTVVGGVHCEVCPQDLDDPSVDFRVVRNATRAWPALLAHVQGGAPVPAGVLRPGEQVGALPPLDFFYPRPARHLVERYRHRYFYIFHDRVALLKTAFGCPYHCSFCFCRRVTEDRFHARPMDEVLDELESLPQREIYIVDDDFLVSRERVGAFLDGLEARGIDKHYLLYGRADFIARHEELIARFRRQGLRTVIVGLESFRDEELSAYDKGTTAATNEAALAVLRRHRVDCFATMILPPQWDREDFAACGAWIRRMGVHYVNLQPLTPLPGTGSEVRDEDLLIPRSDFVRWDLAHLIVRPTKLSQADYYHQIIRLYMASLYRPKDLLAYLRAYRPIMLARMTMGTWRVRRQYLAKRAQARRRGV